MQIIAIIFFLFLAYLIGGIPTGLLIVKLFTGKDIRQIESGRTGGTNAMRAAGFGAGLLTAILDILKAAVCVWLATWWFPGNVWVRIFAPLLAIIGHNYSIWLAERDESGIVRLRGGAGGAPCLGGAFGLWWPNILILVPLGAIVLFVIGYASLATMSIALLSTIIFAYRAYIGASPWEYLAYGIIAEIILIWSLRPNIRRLLSGNERVVGLRARHKKL